ncbi:beta strand repeat-containing protein [Knoellia sp. CPCC 206450]|uniref:beta strand repeat-containing protein n=1 Tax=Knoellia tibetensis TaxID=3404798 RepID=UPI003B43B9FD
MNWTRRSGAVLVAAAVAFTTTGPAGAASPPPAPAKAAAAAATGGYVALSPARLLDTRGAGTTVDGQSRGGGPLGPGATRTVKVTGRGGVPTTGVAAVVLNVTAVKATTSAYVTVFPAGETRPNASNINVVAGDVSPNAVVVKVGASGSVSLFLSAGSSDMLADVAGYYPADGSFTSLSPGRLLDTRASGTTVDGQAKAGGAIGAGGTRDLQVAGRYGIPTTGVDAVVLNVTGVRPTAGTYLSVWPTGSARPNASNLNLAAGETKPNLVVAKLGTGGKVSFFNAGGKVDVLADVAGWIPTGTSYSALTPARLLDTRPTGTTVDGLNQRSGAVGAGSSVNIQVTGRHGIPSTGVSAVVLNVTGVGPTASTYVTAYPTGEPRPNASNLNLVRGETRPNLVFVKVGTGGKVSLFNAGGSVNLLADVAGWFGEGSTTPGPTVTTTSLVGATVGSAYSQTLAASGGATPYTWSLASGTLPAGLALAPSTGLISGTPTTAETKTFTVQVKDAGGLTATKSLTITVSPAPPGPQITTTTLTNATVGSGYDVAITATGGTTPYTWSVTSGTLPTGLSLGASTGRITGTPTSTGTSFFTVQVRDATAKVDAQPLSIIVDPVGSGTIKGTVTDTSATPKALTNVRVVLRSTRRAISRETTTVAGAYSFTKLPATSDWTVCFGGANATGGATDATGYAASCHAENTATGTPGHIDLPSAATKTINRALKAGAAMSGTVTNSAATPAGIAGISVSADESASSYSSIFQDNAVTSTSGAWLIKGLRPGTYGVCFDSFSANFTATSGTGWLDECWNDQHGFGVPTPVVVTAGTTKTGVNAALAAGGAVTGKVTDTTTGLPLAGVSVQISGPSFGFATTSATGTWTVRGLETGTYEVCFDDFGNVTGGAANGYLGECWNDQPQGSGTEVAVTAGATKTGINAGLLAGGRITGKVTSPAAAAIANVGVDLYEADGGYVTSGRTAADGTYALKGIVAGTGYKVCFAPNDDVWSGECWNDKPTLETANGITVAAGGTTANINAVLALGGAITGTVSEATGTLKKLGDVQVSVSSNTTDTFGFTRTLSDGTYRVAGLNPGTDYRVCFSGRNGTGGANDVRGYVDECWNDKASGSGDPVTVTGGGTTANINAGLAPAGAVSGKVTQASSAKPLAGVSVTARTATGFTTERAVTDVDGTYTINVLAPASNYQVCFSQTFGGNGGTNDALGYVEQCWQNKPLGQTPTAVVVAGASTRTGVNAALADAGGIKGTVTDAGTGKLRGVEVTVSTGTSSTQSVFTGADGTYQVSGVAPGTAYVVCFEAQAALGGAADNVGYLSECWNNKPFTKVGATPVTVTAGVATPNINASLSPASGISGVVTEAGSGKPLEDVSVQVESDSLNIFEFASTSATGAWSVRGLPVAADYTVCFDPSFSTGGTSTTGHVEQCWNNKPDVTTATKVATTAGVMKTGVGASVAAAGGISGKVTAATGGAALGGVDVIVQRATGSGFGFATTAADGTWKVTGLAAATDWVVCFESATVAGLSYFGECWNNQPDETTATKVVVTAGAVVANVNGTLERAGTISGKVTAQTGGAALAGVDVSVSNDSTFEFATTAADGTYSVPGLAPASDYVVCFSETTVAGVTYFGECWNNQPDESTATKVAVTGGATTANINGTLGSAGGMSGKVTAASGGAALDGVEVTVSSDSTFVFEFATTAADGTWSVPGLPPANDYVVCFDGTFATGGPSTTGYAYECWDNQPDESTATKVTVASGTTKTGVNAALTANP